jgi:hypothetical protein
MSFFEIFKSLSIDDSSEPLPHEPGMPAMRTLGIRTLTLQTREGVGADGLDLVVIDGAEFRRERR